MKYLETEWLPQILTVHGLTKDTEHLKHKWELANPDINCDEINYFDSLDGMDHYFRIVKG